MRQAGWASRGRPQAAVCGALLVSACALPPEPAAADADSRLRPWVEWRLPGKQPTTYRSGVEGGRRIVVAEASASASMLRRKLRVDAGALQRLRFAWRVDELVAGADLRDQDLEDSPVRVVLAFDGDFQRLPLQERIRFELASAITGEMPPYATLMYVWDNEAPLETVIPGGRSDRIRKIVVDRGAAEVGAWRIHERDVLADFRRAFGEDPGALIGVGLLTDADNTGARARAAYGEIELIGSRGERL